MDQRTVIELLKRYLKILIAEGILINKAYLYGSFSNNSANDRSDIDVLIVSDNFDNDNDEAVGRIWYLTKKVNTKIEPFLVSTKRFYSEESSPLIQIVKQQGIEIN